MRTQRLTDALQQIENWPAEAQDELAVVAMEFGAGMDGAAYRASAGELAGIDRGLAAASRGHFAPDDAVALAFESFGKR